MPPPLRNTDNALGPGTSVKLPKLWSLSRAAWGVGEKEGCSHKGTQESHPPPSLNIAGSNHLGLAD